MYNSVTNMQQEQQCGTRMNKNETGK